MNFSPIPKTSVLVLYFAVALQTALEFIQKNFGSVRLEQIVFFLVDEDGIIGTEPSVIQSALLLLVLKPLVLLGLGGVLWKWACQKTYKTNSGRAYRSGAVALVYKGLLMTHWLVKHSWILLIGSALMLASEVGAMTMLERVSGRDVFSKRYVVPPLPNTTPRLSKDLLFIYVESLESTLRDPTIFGSNLIEPIDDFFESPPISIQPSPGTGWTIAGMISSQCAVPLQNFMGNRLVQKTGHLLSSASCLSDHLKARGAKQYFLVGHDVRFSGMNKFYSAHGYDGLTGVRELAENYGLPYEYNTGWGNGLHDDTLLKFAYSDIKRLKQLNDPFGYVILTSDSHAPDGFPSPNCSKSEKESGFAGTFACTSKIIAKFLRELDNDGLLENTMVVLMGDHPFFANPSHSAFFSKAGKRYVYFNFRDPSRRAPQARRLQITHFDVAPTVLEMMTDHKKIYSNFGLGVSIFEEANKEYLEHLNDVTNEDILNYSKTYKDLWISKNLVTGAY